ncbi:MAG: hypothetical protein HDKAJFGB_02530 [Anaerolineae bacterium]|nr:hypothetical protein [Anaerolineae bacterium]RIK32811.1 MAG: hypothetical protein DCC52_04765 [Chloroflexota bacterium]
MNCWHCDRPSHGACRFCGRAVCKDHAQTMPFILEIYTGKEGEFKAIAVDNTLYCGVCKPHEDPITLKNLK